MEAPVSKALQAPDDGYWPPDDGELGDLPGLLRFHHDQLRKSAISDEVIGRRGYQSVGRPSAGDSSPRDKLKRLGIPGWARRDDARFPGILMPLYHPTGNVSSWQYRPDVPPKDPATGKVRKYAAPVGRVSVVDVHPLRHDRIIDPAVPLWVTEGVKKADSLTTRGLCAVALAGVFNFRSQLGTLGEWEDIYLKSRQVNIIYDSDIFTNVQVRRAAGRLGAWLKSKGARPVFLWPPEIDGEQPKGVDDYFYLGGDLAHLWGTHSETLPPSAARTGPRQGIPYREDAGGIVWDRPTAQGATAQPLTNFTAKITGHTIRDDGSGELRQEFQVTACLKGQARTFGVPAERFATMNWPTEHLGPTALVWPGMGVKDHARAAVQMLSGDVPVHHVYTHTGWRELPGRHGYLTSSGATMADGLDESVTVDLDGSLSRYELPALQNRAEEIEAVRMSLSILDLAADSVAVPLLGAVYRAPLPLLPDCAVWLRGLSGALKTALCALAQQHFGARMDAQHLPGSWESTENRLEIDAHAVAGAVFVVDDFRPDLGAFEARRRARSVDRLVRGSANQSSRDRLRSDASRRPSRPPRAQILCSAEDLPPGAASLRARTMITQVARPPAEGSVDTGKLSAVQGAAGDAVLALAMAGYVQWLAGQFPGLPGRIKSRLEGLRDAARAGGHLRTALNIASIFLGWESWLHYAVKIGAITDDEGTQLWHRAWKVLCDLGADQARYHADADPIAVFLRALRAMITSGRGHLAAMAGSQPAEPGRWGWALDSLLLWRAQGHRLGWADGDDVFLDADVCYQAARQWAEQAGTPLGVSKAQLLDDMRERAVLASTDPGRTTVRRDLSGQRSKRVLHLTAHTFENYGQ
jgi:hypothetical protein